MMYKVPLTLTISCVALIEAGSPEGALTDIKTMLDFSGDEFENCEELLFDSDSEIEVTEATQVGEASFGVVEEVPAEAEDADAEEHEDVAAASAEESSKK